MSLYLLPQPTDQHLKRWKKILTYWQLHIATPAYAVNDPKETDTLRVTLVKLLRAIVGSNSASEGR